MKFRRVLLVGAVVIAGLLLAAVGVACSSKFQTWAARRALAGQPGIDVSVGRVAAGWNQLRLDEVRAVQDGAVLTLPAVRIELPVFAAALRQKVLVRHLEARGWTLDLTHLRPRPVAVVAAVAPSVPRDFSLLPSAYGKLAPTVAPVVFAGIFKGLRLPVDLALDGVDLAGDILLPALPGRPAARAKITITGGSLAAGHPGKFDYTAVIMFEGDGVAVRELHVSGTLGVVMDTPRTFSRFVAAIAADAVGPKFPNGVKLAVDLAVARAVDGENYALAVRSGAKQLGAIETSFAAGESHLRGTWRLDMHDTDLAPFVLGRELPVFEAAGEGRFDLDSRFVELNASGRLNATASRLAAIRPALAVLGSVQLAAEFDLTRRGDDTRVDRLAVTITGAKPVISVQALQAFAFNLKTHELNVADPAKDLLGIVFQGLPLTWISPLLDRAGFSVTGVELQGEFAASARNGGFALRPKAPLTIGHLSVTREGGRALLRDVDVSVMASADYAPQGWQVELAPFAASRNGAPLFALEVKAGQLAGKAQPIKVAGDWTAQLPGLLGQPFADGGVSLTGGEAHGEFAASLGPKREVQVRVALMNLVAATLGPLPGVTADLRADLDANGKVTFNAPLTFDRAGRKSDLTLAGTLMTGPGGPVVDARVTSEFLAIDDVQTLAAPLLAAPVDPTMTAGNASVTGPAQPFWKGVGGRCVLALKKVAYGDKFQVADINAVLRVEGNALKFTEGRAGFGPDSMVRLTADLTCAPAGPRPYALAADLALENFDSTALFRALDSVKPATIEGRFNLQSHLTGTGVTLADLAEHTRGDLRLTSKGGIFRALSADLSDRIQKTQSRVAAIGSFLGVVTDDYVNKTKIISDIAKALAEIPYDQLSVTALRDDSLNLVIKDFTLISPEVRLGGSGLIHHAPDVPLVAQALELQLNLGARGRLGDLMKRAGLLEAQQDSLGYAAFAVPLKLGGTLAKPDTGAIRDALLNSALERSGLLDSLFGRGK
jgi:hypothetical protein